jgi:hypothetical protein
MPGKTSSRNPRNRRNNPYVLDDLAFRVHRSAAGVIWRMRTELATFTTVTAGFVALIHVIAIVGAAVILATSTAVIMAVPHSRRFVIRRAWCVLSRHRMQRVFFETRMHTRSGRLSLVLRIHPTEVGERALIWCRAGICFDDFEDHTGEIAAACYAREARVERSRRWAQIVVVHIVRRDTLAAHNVIPSGLAPKLPAPAPDDERTTA